MTIFNEIAWTRVNANTWTTLYSGPSIHLIGLQSLLFRTFPVGTPDYSVAWSWRRYSAVPPFYYQISGSGTARQTPDLLSPIGIYVGSSSPWTHIWILTDKTIFAKTW
jgi:hypothetical protein